MDLANAINLGGLGIFSYVVWWQLRDLITVLRGLRTDMREDRQEVTTVLSEYGNIVHQNNIILRRSNGYDDHPGVGRG